MLYNLISPFLKLALSVYFRKIYISGMERIPADKPVVFAANHPSAFIEPVILACWQKRPLNFMARGDLYLNSPFIRWLYHSVRLIPIYRLDDAGYSQLKSNYSSIDHCAAALDRQGALVILAEGRTKHEKRLRPIMKGTARVVFTTMKDYESLDIHIVPVGVNYSDSDRFREIAMLDIGPPIRVADFKETYREQPAAAINAVTQAIRERLVERVIHIQDPEDDAWVDFLLQMQLNTVKEDLTWVFSDRRAVLERQLGLAKRLNDLPASEKGQLKALVTEYRADLDRVGITDKGLYAFRTKKHRSLAGVLPGYLLFLASLPFNLLPLLFSYLLSRRLVKAIEFRASVLFAVAAVSYIAYWFLCTAAFLWLGPTWLAAAALVFPLTGYYSVIYLDYWRDRKAARRVGKLSRPVRDARWDLREEILRLAGEPI